ncbi:hypothetical protein [Amycolatopsis sp. cmx-8-4]|uniref:hypothetical protein n=1 Tax=Amycolatopsis sp. cmx-8-4 TaxID=2790947 RepID=UPI00397D9A26
MIDDTGDAFPTLAASAFSTGFADMFKLPKNLYPNYGKRLIEGLAPAMVPRWDAAAFFPEGNRAASAISYQVAGLVGFTDTINQAMAPYTERWREIFSSLVTLSVEWFPPNLDAALPSYEQLEVMLVDEGIPLAWVPRSDTVRSLSNAATAVERRRILGRRWRGIAGDCASVIAEVDHADLRDSRGFAMDCVRALQDGHSNAAQALAANLLDSLMQRHMTNARRVDLTRNELKKNGTRFDLDGHKLRVALTFAPVWYAHAKYRPDQGDVIPRVFGRHPTVHGVSRTQYSRINSIIGLMLVTSVLKYFDVELPR